MTMVPANIGTVYAMRRGFHGPVKFGFTTNGAWRRAEQLQTGSAEPIFAIADVPGTRSDEASIHRALDDFRMSGEWFFPAKKVEAAAKDFEGFVCSLRQSRSLFDGMMAAYALDGEFRRTEMLTHDEFHLLIKHHEDLLAQRTEPTNDLRRAASLLKPFWLAEMTFADAEAAYRKQAAKPVSHPERLAS